MHVVVITGALSPYHLARMSAAERLMNSHSWRVTTIERVGYQAEYSFFGGAETLDITLNRAYTANHPSPTNRESEFQLRQLLSELHPECVVFGRSSPVYLSVLSWCVEREIPSVLLSASTVYDFKRDAWKEWIKARITQLFAAGFAGGSRQRDYLISLGMASDKVVPGYDVVDNVHFTTGADLARADAQCFRERLCLPENYFLACSRFVEKKNLFRLIEAYADYAKRIGSIAWNLVLVGDGSLRSQVEERIQSLGLTDRVVLTGLKPYEALPAYYGLANAFILASTSEQWGLVVNEAMAAGLPVLVSDRCGCATDLAQHGVNGFTFNPLDVQELAARMSDVASHDCDRTAMGMASREIISHWTPETFAAGLMKAVEHAMEAPRPKASILDKALLWALGPK